MTPRLSFEKLDRVVIRWDREAQGRSSMRCISDVQVEKMSKPLDKHVSSSGDRSGIRVDALKYLKP